MKSPNNVPNIILLGQTEEFSDFCGTLGTESLGVDDVCETWDIILTLLDDRQSKN